MEKSKHAINLPEWAQVCIMLAATAIPMALVIWMDEVTWYLLYPVEMYMIARYTDIFIPDKKRKEGH